MFKQKWLAAAIVGGMLLSLCPQITWAEGYTSAKLLAENAEAQKNFIEISLTMAGAVATQVKPEIARCLDDWFFKDAAKKPQRIEHILATMRQYPGYHPSGVLLGVIQQACGSFKP